MIRVDNIKLPIGHNENDLVKRLKGILRIDRFNKSSRGTGFTYRILRQSIDARRKPEISYVYSVAVTLEQEDKIIKNLRNKNVYRYSPVNYIVPERTGEIKLKGRPVIVGSGPAGLFCAYILCQKGYAPLVLERGECVEERKRSVEEFWKGGKLKADSNVQFGEGGAGTFSDGKLNTGVNDKQGRNQYVLDTFVKFGADEGISYKARPHIGTDVLEHVVRKMREYITEHGGCFLFNTKMTGFGTEAGNISEVYACCRDVDKTDISIKTNCAVLATGHSARDTFRMLYDEGIEMVQKNFAVGLRIQHPQEMIDRAQYGDENKAGLPAADYKLTNHTSNGRNVYSFCMCPGGYVVNASGEEGRTAINGMSYSGRDSLNANSAIIVSVDKDDFGSDDPLAGVEFQRMLEEKAYALGKGKIPVQTYGEFRRNVTGTCKIYGGPDAAEMKDPVKGLFKGAYEYTDLSSLFTESINEALVESIDKFSYTIKDFDRPDALLAGVESRTSSPVRILRNDDLEGSVKGLYPCGEGAGYAGGITSAAMDGIKVAEKIMAKYSNEF